MILAVGGLSNDTVGRHLTYLFLFGMFVAVGPPLLAAYGGTTSLPVLAMWGMAICFMVGGLAGIGAQVALSAMPRQEVLAGGLGLIAALSAVGLGTSWWGGRRIYLRQATEGIASERQWRWPVTTSSHEGVPSPGAPAGDWWALPGASPWTVTLGP
ncbi:hypothetical protein BKH13_09750 [Actinomyces naeslundii]|uniref:Uncharacterized protein n=1 Tax=Actinomyces naeslundii TaxID=1655 RepID=A0ABX3F1J1_ACTNA|nr:hypothetical protein BKH13_09750 [Actinomyces naeslundii]